MGCKKFQCNLLEMENVLFNNHEQILFSHVVNSVLKKL